MQAADLDAFGHGIWIELGDARLAKVLIPPAYRGATQIT